MAKLPFILIGAGLILGWEAYEMFAYKYSLTKDTISDMLFGSTGYGTAINYSPKELVDYVKNLKFPSRSKG